MTSHARALALIDDSALDAPELRCRAILVIGDCLGWNPVGDLASARALVSEAGWLAIEHGWPSLAARAALTYQWLMNPGVVDPTAAELVRAVLDMGADDDWRPGARSRSLPVSRRRTVIAPTTNGPSPRSRPRPPRSSAAIRSGRMLVADSRWWLHFADADADDRTLARHLGVARDAVGGIWMLLRSPRCSAHPCDTGTATTSTPPSPSSHSSRLAPAWDRPMSP